MDKVGIDPISEMVLEESWQISRRFMREIEDEAGQQIPVNIMLQSKELVMKWLRFVMAN